MIRSMSFLGKVVLRGHRKQIEIPKDARGIVPTGRYQITLAYIGTITGNEIPTE